MKIVVLGSGVIGTATAWWLAAEGHEVVVVDRQAGPGRETTRGCGGVVSASYAEPWASPQMPWQLLRWLCKDDAPLMFKPSLDSKQWLWSLAFLRECQAKRFESNLRAMVRLAEYSRDALVQLRHDLKLNYAYHQYGILNFYRDEHSFSMSQSMADRLRDIGIERRLLSVSEMLEIEPTLHRIKGQLVGGDYSSDDEAGSAYEFTNQLAQKAQAKGVQFLFQHQVEKLHCSDGRVRHIEVIDNEGQYQHLQADAFVVALGAYSSLLLKPLGIACPIYPAKGYSVTFPVLEPKQAPKSSLIDSKNHLMFTRLGAKLRVSGLAELTGYSRTLSHQRCAKIVQVTKELFPNQLDFDNVQYWSGLRPATPSNLPFIGRSHIKNLYLNTGHGTLGWTMGVGSGRALADIIAGREPEPEFPFLH